MGRVQGSLVVARASCKLRSGCASATNRVEGGRDLGPEGHFVPRLLICVRLHRSTKWLQERVSSEALRGLVSGCATTACPSATRSRWRPRAGFVDGGHYGVEIPVVNNFKVLEATLGLLRKEGLPVTRFNETLGAFLLSDARSATCSTCPGERRRYGLRARPAPRVRPEGRLLPWWFRRVPGASDQQQRRARPVRRGGFPAEPRDWVAAV